MMKKMMKKSVTMRKKTTKAYRFSLSSWHLS